MSRAIPPYPVAAITDLINKKTTARSFSVMSRNKLSVLGSQPEQQVVGLLRTEARVYRKKCRLKWGRALLPVPGAQP
jgi:hypothetical protein